MPKTAKITFECDGQKMVWESDSFHMHQNRDVKTRYDIGDPKPKFKPGDSTMVLVVFRPRLISEECIPVPTLEKAFGMTSPNQAQAVQESRRDMVSENTLDEEKEKTK